MAEFCAGNECFVRVDRTSNRFTGFLFLVLPCLNLFVQNFQFDLELSLRVFICRLHLFFDCVLFRFNLGDINTGFCLFFQQPFKAVDLVRLKIIHQVFVSFKHNGASPAAKHSPLVITCRNSISNASFPAQTPAAKKTEQGIFATQFRTGINFACSKSFRLTINIYALGEHEVLGKVERSFTFGIETHTIDNDQVSSMAEGTSNAGAGEIRCGIEATVARQTMPCSCDCIF
ncbi:hypothetical protein KOSB73_350005 [Klebsiella grimontii]|uniref:Uncharacterized protein n=1 Tax=Klebsiella grimontii TaxID=2058152 RepID=A0A285B8Y7_9ENTR|nr:hypothetical protein KOSB73_350005 [Klebsiella grimontii]